MPKNYYDPYVVEDYNKWLRKQPTPDYNIKFKTNPLISIVTPVFNVDKKSFNSVLCLDGEGTIFCDNKTYTLTKGDSYFIPAGIGAYVVNGNVQIVVSKINNV